MHDLLDFLDPECHALWTHLESRLEDFKKTKALVILAQALTFLGQALTFLGQALEFLDQALVFLVQASKRCLYNEDASFFLSLIIPLLESESNFFFGKRTYFSFLSKKVMRYGNILRSSQVKRMKKKVRLGLY